MKMKKAAAAVLAVVMAGAMLAGCSNGETKETSKTEDGGSKSDKLVVYGIYKAGDQTWFIDEGKAAEKAVKDAGGEFIYVDAKMNPEEYLKAIDNAIANNASGIVTCTPDQTMSQAVVTKCEQAGIPVVAADDALQEIGRASCRERV